LEKSVRENVGLVCIGMLHSTSGRRPDANTSWADTGEAPHRIVESVFDRLMICHGVPVSLR